MIAVDPYRDARAIEAADEADAIAALGREMYRSEARASMIAFQWTVAALAVELHAALRFFETPSILHGVAAGVWIGISVWAGITAYARQRASARLRRALSGAS